MFNNGLKDYLEHLLSFKSGGAPLSEAERISDAFDNLNYLLHTDEFAVRDMTGCDESTADYLRLIAALTSRRITDKFKNGKKYLQNELKEYIVGLFFGSTVENVYLIMFDAEGRLISSEHLGDGTVNSSGFLPRKMLDVALRKRAKSVILAHNHPCGNPDASKNDIATSFIAKSVLLDARVELLHHYIVSGFDIIDCLESTVQNSDGAGDN